MLDRRRFLQGKLSLPLWGGWLSQRRAAAAPPPRDFFKELGVRGFINAAEPFTALTGSLMAREVAEAWDYAVPKYVRLDELHDAIGRRIASLIGCEAAMVTSGAAAALTLATAACMTGADRDKIRRLPDTNGMKTEVIIQKSHRYGYDHAVRNCGIRYVEVDTAEELVGAINERTAMMHFFNTNDPLGKIKLAEFAAIGKKHDIPTGLSWRMASPSVRSTSNCTWRPASRWQHHCRPARKFSSETAESSEANGSCAKTSVEKGRATQGGPHTGPECSAAAGAFSPHALACGVGSRFI